MNINYKIVVKIEDETIFKIVAHTIVTPAKAGLHKKQQVMLETRRVFTAGRT